MQLVSPQLGIVRDLHCWQLRFSWVPSGPRQSYMVTLNATSGMLSDMLKLERNRSWYNR